MNPYPPFKLSPWVFKPILQYANENRISIRQLLKPIGCTEADLMNLSSPVDYYLLHQLITELYNLTEDDAIGLKLGSTKNMLSGHLLDYLVRSCDTVFDAVGKIDDYNILLSDFLFVKINKEEGYFRVTFPCLNSWVLAYPFSSRIIRDCVTVFMMNLIAELSNWKALPVKVMLGDRTDSNGLSCAMLNTVFPVKPIYDGSVDQLVYPVAANVLVISSNATVKQTLENYIREIPVVNETKKNITQRIRWQMLNMGIHMLDIQIEEMARMNHLSVRRLQQLLKEEQTSFREIYNEVKIQVVKKMLRVNGNSIKEMADKMGYANANALSAFVKKYTGLSPYELLRQL